MYILTISKHTKKVKDDSGYTRVSRRLGGVRMAQTGIPCGFIRFDSNTREGPRGNPKVKKGNRPTHKLLSVGSLILVHRNAICQILNNAKILTESR